MNIKLLQKRAKTSYEDLLDTIGTIEAIKAQGFRRMKKWSSLKKEFKKNV